jgi:hypothetical protein
MDFELTVMPMHKEEMVLLHLALFNVKRFFENAGLANGHFKLYDELGVQPVHIHKSKAEHKKAILLLCKGISEIFKERHPHELVNNPKIRELLETIAHQDSKP